MVQLESNYSATGNLPAVNNLGAIPCCPHVSETLPLCDPPYTISRFSSVVPRHRLTLAHAATFDPGGPGQS